MNAPTGRACPNCGVVDNARSDLAELMAENRMLRRAISRSENENRTLAEALTQTQERCTSLLEESRALRIQLNDERSNQ
jgi:hypothetical protein